MLFWVVLGIAFLLIWIEFRVVDLEMLGDGKGIFWTTFGVANM